MVVNDDACGLDKRGALESIASKLAPTVWRSHHFDQDAGPCRSPLQAGSYSPSPASWLLQFPGNA
ncbi:hypothetical protein CRX42_21135 [Pseudomonas jessenii]|uniref:Uncharacterized protein n=1 Tax=Pseudomonas jessenii TaxID=77298 RepID=A0A2W0EIY8_PSEJE|nr:hypothetical protein CRX42_21135 [Pseudomonas jessenii]